MPNMASSKLSLQIETHVFAALRAGAFASTASRVAEQIAETEEIAEDIAEIRESFRVVAGRASGALHAGVAEAIVSGAFLRIAQDAIRLARFLEFFLGVGIVRIAVGMVSLGEFAVSAFDFLIAGILTDT